MTLFMYLVALVLILIYPLYLYITKPLNRIKRHGDLGYHFGTPEVRFRNVELLQESRSIPMLVRLNNVEYEQYLMAIFQ